MESWLNYHHLYYFYVIATEGGVAKAAQRLRLGQPTLSAQLKQFESTLGVLLFERKHKRLILTDQGRLALQYAQEIFQTGSELLDVLQDRAIPNRLHVQIGALDSVPKQIVAKMVEKALSFGPCTISVLEGKGDELIRELINHKIDLFVTNTSPSADETAGLFSKSIAKVPVAILGSPRFKSLKNGFPHTLARAPLILPTRHSKLRHDLEHFFSLNKLALNLIVETQDTSIHHRLALAGLGIFPTPVLEDAESSKKPEFVDIGRLPGVYEEYFFVSASRKIENPVSARLIKEFDLKSKVIRRKNNDNH
ncbi:MAG: LysR family transcriptional regulator [Oligoflexia bacterium]|nr:LysR family transcriptional regulator [Oligoflexia bacterium]